MTMYVDTRKKLCNININIKRVSIVGIIAFLVLAKDAHYRCRLIPVLWATITVL